MTRSISQEYVNKIKRWVELDNAVEVRKAKIKVMTDEKKKLEEAILEYVEDNDMKNVQFNLADGNIKFIESKTQQGFTLKTLKEGLDQFFQKHKDQSQITAKAIFEFLSKNRPSKDKLTIKRQITAPAS